jgi:hypothetical protein
MADNVAITAGSGTSVATDDIGGVQFQRQKLALGPDGTHTADAAGRVITGSEGALYVDPRRKTVRVQATPVISNGVAYAAGDCLGPLQTVANAVRAGALSGRIIGVTILDKTQAQRATIDLAFFSATVTTAADNSPFQCSDADMINCLGILPLTNGLYNVAFPGTPLNSILTVPSPTVTAAVNAAGQLNFPIVTAGTDLFMQPIIREVKTYTSTSDIVISLTIEQD